MFIDDTIAAIATAPGEGGIGIIRISGSNALPVAEEIFQSVSGKDITDYNVIIYTKEKFNIDSNNITFKTFSNEFKSDLENAFCLISTAGHQLLSESISIEVPAYLIPLSTYEQNYNAKMIEKYNLGKISSKICDEEIKQFIKKVPYYKKKIIKFKNKYYKNNWEKSLLEIINTFM